MQNADGEHGRPIELSIESSCYVRTAAVVWTKTPSQPQTAYHMNVGFASHLLVQTFSSFFPFSSYVERNEHVCFHFVLSGRGDRLQTSLLLLSWPTSENLGLKNEKLRMIRRYILLKN